MDILSEIVSWVSRILGGGKPSAGNSWQDYARLSSPARPSIVASDLVDMSSYRKAQRMAQCGGIDPLEVFVAYAQDNHVYDAGGRIAPVDAEIYRHTPPDGRVNKFKQVYRHDAKLLLHKALADIVVDAAMELQTQHGWKLRLYDGLRTVDAAFLMHYNADPKWLEAGLLAKPGESAHNRGLAIDSMVVDAGGREIDMGGHFDHLRMETNGRNYSGNEISEAAKQNRRIREIAFQRAALGNGTLLAPLRSEFWDDRMPGSEKDLWRVMESVCRCIGVAAPPQRAEDYATFCSQWARLDAQKLTAALGEKAVTPLAPEKLIFHERFNPLYDADLPESMRLSMISPERLPSQNLNRAA